MRYIGGRSGIRLRLPTLAKDRPHTKGQALKEEAHYVYRRNGRPCWVCGTKVSKMEGFAGRNLFWCPVCQG